MNKENKVAVITGASRGIGRAIAFKLAEEQFDLALCSRNEKDLQKVKNELSNAFPTIQIFVKACDVSNKISLQEYTTAVVSHFDRIDVLVNNAGLFTPGNIHEEEDGALEKMIETNLYSAYRLTKSLLPHMIAQKEGHIFNICSVASIMAYENGGSYSISKFGMLGFSKVLREEMKSYNIKVTAMLPGATYTSSWKESNLSEERFMRPEDVASLLYDIYKINDRSDVEEIILRPVLGDI